MFVFSSNQSMALPSSLASPRNLLSKLLNLFKRSKETAHRHFFFGGADGVAQELKHKLEEQFPKAVISGIYTPPFRPLTREEEEELVNQIQEAKPHFFWVGLSTPKQERFMANFLDKYGERFKDWNHGLIMLGVGAAFDFHSGKIDQAPRWIQRSGFEWLFRVCKDPRRLWKRYAVGNSIFISKIIPAMMGITKYRLNS